MQQNWVRSFLALSLLLLSACSGYFRSDVTTFHTAELTRGNTIFLEALNAERADSIEINQYLTIVAANLSGLGYRIVDNRQTAQLVAGVDAWTSEGRTVTRRTGGHFGFGYGVWAYPYYWGFTPYHHYGAHDRVRTEYGIGLTVEMRQSDGPMVFEGRALAKTSNPDLPAQVPLLAQALFQDFPGENGRTREVRLDLD